MESQEPSEEWLMLAFPGTDTGRYSLRAFAPAKSGKCWFRKLRTREAAIACKRELLADGIRYQCKKVLKAIRRQPIPHATNDVKKPGAWRLKDRRRP